MEIVFVMLAFVGFVVVAVILVLAISGIKDSLRRISQDVYLLTQRIDYLRREMEKTMPGLGQPQDRRPSEPALPGAPPMPSTPPVQSAQPMPSAGMAIQGPPPLPTPESLRPAGVPLPPREKPPLPYPPQVPPDFMKMDVAEHEPEETKDEIVAYPVGNSPMVESVKEILMRIWNWLLVNEEHRPKGVTAEYAVATTWLLRVGILLVAGGFAYCLTSGLLRPETLVGLCIMGGLAMIVGGLRMIGNKYRLLGQGLLGGGLLVLYFSGFAAGSMFKVFGPQYSIPVAFGMMILITVAAGVIAVRLDSMLTAVIGIAGGYSTPLLLRTETPNLPGLYSYVLLLGLGILAISRVKQWRFLNYLSFAGTYVLFSASMFAYKLKDFTVAMSFLSAYFVVHSMLVYVHNIVNRSKSTVLEILQLAANAVLFAGFGYHLIYGAYGRPYPAIMSVALAAFFVVHVFVFLKRRLDDRMLLTTLIALAGVFTTWTMPLVFEKESLTISFALLGLMFLWVSKKIRSNFLESLSHCIYMVVFIKLIGFDLMDNFRLQPVPSSNMTEYWSQMWHRLWTFGISIGSIVAAFVLQRREPAAPAEVAVPEGSDLPHRVENTLAQSAFYWFAVLFTFIFLQFEIHTMFAYWLPMRLTALTFLWCAMAAFFLWRYVRGGMESIPIAAAMAVFCMIAILKLSFVDLAFWHFTERFIYDMEYRAIHVAARTLDFGFIMLICLLIWHIMGRKFGEKSLGRAFGYMALFLLFAYTTLELRTLLAFKKPEFLAAGVSILWALFAMSFVGAGIWSNVTPLRYIGLTLFFVVVVKVIFSDLQHMQTIYKMLACVVVGALLIVGAFAYIKADQKFAKQDDANKPAPDKAGDGPDMQAGDLPKLPDDSEPAEEE